MKKRFSSLLLACLLAVWISAVAGGLWALSRYSSQPGNTGKIAAAWPPGSRIQPETGHRPTLILFLHPKCPCSRASVGELDRLMARIEGKARVIAVFVQPRGWSEADVKAALWQQAAAIPGVETFLDPDGEEAKRFGGLTSGHLFAFDAGGTLGYSGGITASRGHMGDNAGLRAAVHFVQTGATPLKQARVFGCSLFKADSPKAGSHGKADSHSHGHPSHGRTDASAG